MADRTVKNVSLFWDQGKLRLNNTHVVIVNLHNVGEMLVFSLKIEHNFIHNKFVNSELHPSDVLKRQTQDDEAGVGNKLIPIAKSQTAT